MPEDKRKISDEKQAKQSSDKTVVVDVNDSVSLVRLFKIVEC